ncbi:retrotransposon protein, putative, ty1-copia subclass [Tanacetum coccineum]
MSRFYNHKPKNESFKSKTNIYLCGAYEELTKLGCIIAPVVIIDRQLPFEYTIASKSTDVMVPLPAAPTADSDAQVLVQYNAVYDAYNEVACLILRSMIPELHRQFENSLPYDMIKELKSMFEKQAGVERFDLIQTFHACKQEDGKPVSTYVLKMKGYVEQLECLSYVLPQDISVGLILNGITSDFAGFVRNYNNMRKTVGELHALLIEYEKGKGKVKSKGKDKSYISKPKNPKPSAKEHPSKDEACHCCKEETQKKIMGYYFCFPPENKIVVARYAKFLEKNLTSQEISRRAEELEKIQDEDTSPSKNTSDIPMEVDGFEPPQEKVVLIRRSARTHRAPDRLCLNVEVEEHSLRDLNEPTNYKVTMLASESDESLDAMNVEMQSMKDNQVCRLVDLPPNYKTIGSKWLFKKKKDMDGNVHTYKAHLVAKGFTQTNRVDYEETFSPITDIRAIRILIAITAFYYYEIWQMDVKTAFLNGYLDEDIYMVQHEGFLDPNHPRKVCKLQRSIYGLKQASRSWNKRINEEIKRFGFAQNLDEPCVYKKASRSNVTLLILYVNDIIIMGNYIPSLQSVKTYLGKCFGMKDLGEATFILGIKIYQDRRSILEELQAKYYCNVLLPQHMTRDSGPDQSFDIPTSLKCMSSLACASLAEVLYLSFLFPYFLAMSKNDMNTHVSDLSETDLRNLIKTYCIPLDLHPCLPDPNLTMDCLPSDAIGIYLQFLPFSGVRIPFSSFLLSVLAYFKVHISQLIPLGLNKVVSFEVFCHDLGFTLTVTLFWVFQSFYKQGDWFSFAKRRNANEVCMDKGPSTMKKWKNKFFIIDRVAVPNFLTYKHSYSCVSDDLPLDSYDRNDVERLCVHLTRLHEMKEAVLVWSRLSSVWSNQKCHSVFRRTTDNTDVVTAAQPHLVLAKKSRPIGQEKMVEEEGLGARCDLE